MDRVKVNAIVLAVVALLLTLCGSGYALKCFSCNLSSQPCTNNVTCATADNACLKVTTTTATLHQCYPYSACSADEISKKYAVNNFEYHCCQYNLCNDGVATVVNKAVFSLVTVLALFWICF